MKKALFYLFILFAFASCKKEENDAAALCTAGFTTIKGRVLTSGGVPLKGVKLQLKYIETRMFYYHSLLKRETTTDANGYYSMSFNIKDGEVMSSIEQSYSYFDLQVDLSNLEPDKYFLSFYSVENTSPHILSNQLSLKRNTIYTESLYIPTKDYITVTLKKFQPSHQYDRFEVQTFFPWGTKSDEKKMLNTEYGISSSGYDHFVAKSESQTFQQVPVARNDTNIIRIVKVKNGVAIPEDHKIFVPENNAIELTYEY